MSRNISWVYKVANLSDGVISINAVELAVGPGCTRSQSGEEWATYDV